MRFVEREISCLCELECRRILSVIVVVVCSAKRATPDAFRATWEQANEYSGNGKGNSCSIVNKDSWYVVTENRGQAAGAVRLVGASLDSVLTEKESLGGYVDCDGEVVAWFG